MISAFGIEHGEFSKSWKKLAPKLARTTSVPKKTDTLQQRQRVNYTQWRSRAAGLRNSVNPHNWDAEDAKNLAAGFGPPHPRPLEVRQRNRVKAHETARADKEGAQAMITGHANAGKKKRFLP